MTLNLAVWVLLGIAVLAANLPWLSERVLFMWDPRNGRPRWTKMFGLALAAGLAIGVVLEILRNGLSDISATFIISGLVDGAFSLIFIKWSPRAGKTPFIRGLEWLVLYVLVGGIALGLEQKSFGERHVQDWEFYAVTLCLFLVFALPGFIYRYDLKGHLDKAKRRNLTAAR